MKPNTTDKFLQADSRGLSYLYQLFPQVQWNIPTDRYSAYDCSTNTFGKEVYVEIKTRDCFHSDFGTAILEAEKLERLKPLMEAGHTVFYYQFYLDGVAYSWNLNKMKLSDCEIFTKVCPKKSMKDVGESVKLCIGLPLNKGKEHYYQRTKYIN